MKFRVGAIHEAVRSARVPRSWKRDKTLPLLSIAIEFTNAVYTLAVDFSFFLILKAAVPPMRVPTIVNGSGKEVGCTWAATAAASTIGPSCSGAEIMSRSRSWLLGAKIQVTRSRTE
jgi:hypothetical protein